MLKHLEPGRVDVKSRRKKIQQMMEEQSPYHKKKKILDFIADGTSSELLFHSGQFIIYQGSIIYHKGFLCVAMQVINLKYMI